MKKTRGKRNINSRKRLNKPVSFFKRFFPVVLIVAVLLNITILFGLDNSTGNVITGQVEFEVLPSNPQSPSSIQESTQLPSNPQSPSNIPESTKLPTNPQSPSTNIPSPTTPNFSTSLIAGIAILIALIGIVFLIRKNKKK